MHVDDEDDRTHVSRPNVEGVRVAPRPAALELVSGTGAPQRFVLSLPAYVVGRDAASDIHIASPELSRRHLRVMRVGADVMAVDQQSANGTFVNGARVEQAVLRDGDRIELGDCVFVFRERA